MAIAKRLDEATDGRSPVEEGLRPLRLFQRCSICGIRSRDKIRVLRIAHGWMDRQDIVPDRRQVGLCEFHPWRLAFDGPSNRYAGR